MAIINQINQKQGLLVGAIVVALALFIIGGELLSPTSFLASKGRDVGEINGNDITVEEYQYLKAKNTNEYEAKYGRPVTENEEPFIADQTWKAFIDRYAFQPEYDKLGLTVTDDELEDMIKGKFVHPIIKQAFGGDQQFDKAKVIDFLSNFEKVDTSIQRRWRLIEEELPKIRIKEKYSNLIKKSEYATKAEAKQQYTMQLDKAEVKYFFVPYYSIPDTAVVVTDDLMRAYLSENISKYKVEDGRSIDYVVFDVKSSSKDSIEVMKQIADLKIPFKEATNDSTFSQENSDQPSAPVYQGPNALPKKLSAISGLEVDSVYGPFSENGNAYLYKILATKNDTVQNMRASHILLRPSSETPEAKAESKLKAEEVLNKIKQGASFEQMAKEYGSDGTSTQGGDLGWFGKGMMVKPFEEACFGAGTKGLVPHLVETQFGYHIIKITELPTSKQYLVASISKEIYASDETKDGIFKKAESFRETSKDTAAFYANIKKDKLNKQSQANFTPSEKAIGSVNNARELVMWAYNDAELGDVSNVFTIDNGSRYVVAVLTDVRKKGNAELKDVKDDVKAKVMNKLKGDKIMEKVKDLKGTFEEMAKAYGAQAKSGTEQSLTMASAYIAGVGFDPEYVCSAFGLKPGKRTQAMYSETGILMIETVTISKAPDIADYSQYSNQLIQQRSGRTDFSIDEAIKKLYDIKDERYKFF